MYAYIHTCMHACFLPCLLAWLAGWLACYVALRACVCTYTYIHHIHLWPHAQVEAALAIWKNANGVNWNMKDYEAKCALVNELMRGC